MTFKSRMVLISALVLLVAPASLPAQRSGFAAAGVPPPAPVVAPTSGQFAVARPLPQRAPNWGTPGFIAAPQVVGQPVVIPFNPYSPFNQSNPSNAFNGPVIMPGVGTGIVLIQPITTFGTPMPMQAVRTPPVGTPRADVLRNLGRPNVTRITRDSEVLYFSGGVTVIIENGHVSRTR